jgi:hypothetical protein
LEKKKRDISSSTRFLHMKENGVKTYGGYKELTLNFAVSFTSLLTHTTDTKRFLNGIGKKENRTSNTQKGTVETQKAG